MQPHRSNALRLCFRRFDGDTQTRCGSWQCHCHGLGLISLRAARERLHPRSAILYFRPSPVYPAYPPRPQIGRT